MIIGMETKKSKIAITLRPEVLQDVRERVERGQARSVSAFVERAVLGQLAAEADFDAMVDAMLAATGGAPTADEAEAARQLLAGSAA